jgi:hypothetical protein
MHLGELLLARGLVTASNVEAALARQEKLGGRIGENLIAMGVITKRTLDAALREQYELAKAILAAEDLLTKSKRINGGSHPKTNRVRCLLAVALTTGGRAAEALSVGRTAWTGHQQALGADHPWTRDSAQAVADAAAVIERATSLDRGGEGSEVPRVVDIADRSDRVAPVGQVTARFVAKPVLRDQHFGPVKRMIGALSRHR